MIPKFRAWIPAEKRMVEVNQIDYTYKTIGYSPKNDLARYFVPFDQIELMQSTGLKDGNGVEIFEGDTAKQSFQYVNMEHSQGEHGGYVDGELQRGYIVGDVVIIPSKGACLKDAKVYVENEDGDFVFDHESKNYPNLRACRAEIIGNKFEGVKGNPQCQP